MKYVYDELRASCDETENSIGKRYGAVRAFGTFSKKIHSLFSTIRVHVAPTLRPRCDHVEPTLRPRCGTPMVKSFIR